MNQVLAEIFKPRVSFQEKLFFTKHMSVMIKSGIVLSEALYILIEQTKSATFRKVLRGIYADIENGKTFSQSVKKYPSIFDQLFVSIMEIGEQSGTLDQSLDFLASQISKDYNLQKKVRGAMMYPSIVFIAAMIMGSYITIFVLPKLTEFFTNLDVKLPITTQILIFIANTGKNYGLIIAPTAAVAFVGFTVLIKTSFVKPIWDALLVRIPVLGTFLINTQLILFCRNTGTMLKSGIPITSALDIQYKATDFTIFKNYVEWIRKSVVQGKTMGSELNSKKFKEFPIVAARMIAIGEKTGKLDEILLYLADFYEEEVDDTIKNLAGILEPIMLLAIGFVVAFIGLAIISPIYELTGSIKR